MRSSHLPAGVAFRLATPHPALLCCCALWALDASATSIEVNSAAAHPAVDPATDFEADCLGAVEADDCDARAAALETELTDNLVALSFETDPETIATFEAMLPLDAPRVQEVAAAYFAALPEQPPTVWGQLRVFFFGNDASLGFAAAEALRRSPTMNDVTAGERYRRFRTAESHGGAFPGGAGDTDSWAHGIVRDLQLDDLYGFAASDLYPNATRLLMDDFVLPDVFASDDPNAELTVTAFVTDDDLATVTAHFAALFGRDPFPSPRVTEEQQTAIIDEMTALQAAIESGDQAALERFNTLSAQLLALQGAGSIGLRLALSTLEAGDHVFWSTLPEDAPFEGPMRRSVAIGADPSLGRTVIRYYADAVASSGEGEGEGEGEGDAPADPSGCGCTGGGQDPPGARLVLLGCAFWTLRRATLNRRHLAR